MLRTKRNVIFLGDESVGKTSIITRLMYDKFNDDAYQGTIGIDSFTKIMNLENRTVQLKLWDTPGQERGRSLIPSYISDSSIAVVIYDVASRQSFQNTSEWVEKVRTERGSDVIIALVGNKTDLVEERIITMKEGVAKARELNVRFLEINAKFGFNVKGVVDILTEYDAKGTVISALFVNHDSALVMADTLATHSVTNETFYERKICVVGHFVVAGAGSAIICDKLFKAFEKKKYNFETTISKPLLDIIDILEEMAGKPVYCTLVARNEWVLCGPDDNGCANIYYIDGKERYGGVIFQSKQVHKWVVIEPSETYIDSECFAKTEDEPDLTNLQIAWLSSLTAVLQAIKEEPSCGGGIDYVVAKARKQLSIIRIPEEKVRLMLKWFEGNPRHVIVHRTRYNFVSLRQRFLAKKKRIKRIAIRGPLIRLHSPQHT